MPDVDGAPEKKSVGVPSPPPPPPPPLISCFWDLREFRGWRRSEKNSMVVPPPPPLSQIPGSAPDGNYLKSKMTAPNYRNVCSNANHKYNTGQDSGLRGSHLGFENVAAVVIYVNMRRKNELHSSDYF